METTTTVFFKKVEKDKLLFEAYYKDSHVCEVVNIHMMGNINTIIDSMRHKAIVSEINNVLIQ